MKVLVIGGLHGNEPFGIELVRNLETNPIEGITPLFGNPRAIESRSRYVEEDLNRVFPGASTGSYEARLAATLTAKAKSFDLILDFHNTPCPDNDCAFIGDESEERIGFASWLGLQRVIIADYACINAAIPKTISIELSLGSSLCSIPRWRALLSTLRRSNELPQGGEGPTTYRFIGRVLRVDCDTAQFTGWQPFVPISPKDVERIGRDPSQKICPIFIGQSYVKEQFAALVSPIN